MTNSFQDLRVWQQSIDLAEKIYKLTSSFPSEEKFGLVSQIRRCSVSIASNIAEGAARNGNREFIQFLSISLGSVAELKTQLFIANRVNFVSKESFDNIFLDIEDISKMLIGLKKSIEKSVNGKLKTVN
jgi:four helix bundle protein